MKVQFSNRILPHDLKDTAPPPAITLEDDPPVSLQLEKVQFINLILLKYLQINHAAVLITPM